MRVVGVRCAAPSPQEVTIRVVPAFASDAIAVAPAFWTFTSSLTTALALIVIAPASTVSTFPPVVTGAETVTVPELPVLTLPRTLTFAATVIAPSPVVMLPPEAESAWIAAALASVLIPRFNGACFPQHHQLD